MSKQVGNLKLQKFVVTGYLRPIHHTLSYSLVFASHNIFSRESVPLPPRLRPGATPPSHKLHHCYQMSSNVSGLRAISRFSLMPVSVLGAYVKCLQNLTRYSPLIRTSDGIITLITRQHAAYCTRQNRLAQRHQLRANQREQVCVQLPTLVVKVALPAYICCCMPCCGLMLLRREPCSNRPMSSTCLPGP